MNNSTDKQTFGGPPSPEQAMVNEACQRRVNPITIRADCTDTELNAAVAEHVMGLTVMRTKSRGRGNELRDDPPFIFVEPGAPYQPLPNVATDANAVLNLLGDDWECQT
jgi:hypothetical protein